MLFLFPLLRSTGNWLNHKTCLAWQVFSYLSFLSQFSVSPATGTKKGILADARKSGLKKVKGVNENLFLPGLDKLKGGTDIGTMFIKDCRRQLLKVFETELKHTL